MKFTLFNSFLTVLLSCGMSALAQEYSVSNYEHKRLTVDARFDKPNAETEAFMAKYKSYVDSINMPVVGHCAKDMTRHAPESEMSNLLADILVWCAKSDYGEKVDFGLYNIGGIRATFSKGAVHKGDVIDVAPFENKICFITMKGSDLLELFEQIAHNKGEGLSHSVRMVITQDLHLKSVTINGKAIKPNAKYRIATIDYLLDGNDGMTALKKATKIVAPKEEKNDTRFIIMNYFAMKEAKGELVDANIEGRVVIEGQQDMDKNSAKADETRELVILHTNDTHSQNYPFSKNLMNKEQADRGGNVRRVNLVNKEREDAPSLLLLDSGDFSQGSPYYTYFKGDVEIGLMNMMKYDAATIGNHEFDFGLDNMARLFKMANFPIVCANYDFTGTVCEAWVKPYTIINRDGIKVGIFGLSPKMEGLVSVKNSVGVKYLDPVAVAKDMVKKLHAEKCDVIICLSHLGYKIGGGEPDDELIASQVPGIDAILGGHTHTALKKPVQVKDPDGEVVLIDQNGKSGIYLSKITLNLDKK